MDYKSRHKILRYKLSSDGFQQANAIDTAIVSVSIYMYLTNSRKSRELCEFSCEKLVYL